MRKLLIVEDDKFLTAIFALFIKDMGHELVGRCRSGSDALDKCKELNPDVVLMDIHLEGNMDGIQTADRIQQDLEIPVIFVSSDTSSSVVERAIISNSYGYLVKPVQKRELAIAVDLAYYKHKASLDQKRREEGFRKVISDAPVPVLVLKGGVIQYLNIEALDLFHTHYIEDMMGLPFLDFVDESFKDKFLSFLDNNNDVGRIKGDVKNIKVNGFHGKSIDVALNASWITFNGKRAMQLVLIDITVEKLVEHECSVLRKTIIEDRGFIVINEFLEVVSISSTFKNAVSANNVFNKEDIEIDESLLKKIFENENKEDTLFSVKYKGAEFMCLASAIGCNHSASQEIILCLE